MNLNSYRFKQSLTKFFNSYLPLLPIAQKKSHLFVFRFLFLIIAILLMQAILLIYYNRSNFFTSFELSNPLEVLFIDELDLPDVEKIVKEIEKISGVFKVELLTAQRLKKDVVAQEPLFGEAESIGLSPFHNIAKVTILNAVGNSKKRATIVSEIESIAGVNLVTYNKQRFSKLDFVANISARVLLFFFANSLLFLFLTSFLSALFIFNFNKTEIEYLKLTHKFLKDLSLHKIFISEGIFSGIFASIISTLILCLLWLFSKGILGFELVFFPIWQVLSALILITFLFSLINLLILRLFKKVYLQIT